MQLVPAVAVVPAAVATVWSAARNSIVWNMSQAVQVMVDQRIQLQVTMVSETIVSEGIQVVVSQAIQWVCTQRIATVVRVNACAIAAFGSSERSVGLQEFFRSEGILLTGVSDECQNGDKKQRLFHENARKMSGKAELLCRHTARGLSFVGCVW
jgi:hypothetical protein